MLTDPPEEGTEHNRRSHSCSSTGSKLELHACRSVGAGQPGLCQQQTLRWCRSRHRAAANAILTSAAGASGSRGRISGSGAKRTVWPRRSHQCGQTMRGHDAEGDAVLCIDKTVYVYGIRLCGRRMVVRFSTDRPRNVQARRHHVADVGLAVEHQVAVISGQGTCDTEVGVYLSC